MNPWPLTRSAWHAVAGRAAVPCIDVEVVCSDAAEHRRRVESRQADIAGHRLPTWQEILDRDYLPWTTDRVIVDIALFSPQQSVETILRVGIGFLPDSPEVR